LAETIPVCQKAPDTARAACRLHENHDHPLSAKLATDRGSFHSLNWFKHIAYLVLKNSGGETGCTAFLVRASSFIASRNVISDVGMKHEISA